ncbi:hypothetical protein [Vallitalea guaymasensis]|uniref:hypothetical protein n=1 Tax=Vallitalea guaymasensis TaxID=1185412 RepID=UPI000DE51834|nr:hypothetical protein [Vallitalea guaymasensis]
MQLDYGYLYLFIVEMLLIIVIHYGFKIGIYFCKSEVKKRKIAECHRIVIIILITLYLFSLQLFIVIAITSWKDITAVDKELSIVVKLIQKMLFIGLIPLLFILLCTQYSSIVKLVRKMKIKTSHLEVEFESLLQEHNNNEKEVEYTLEKNTNIYNLITKYKDHDVKEIINYIINDYLENFTEKVSYEIFTDPVMIKDYNYVFDLSVQDESYYIGVNESMSKVNHFVFNSYIQNVKSAINKSC